MPQKAECSHQSIHCTTLTNSTAQTCRRDLQDMFLFGSDEVQLILRVTAMHDRILLFDMRSIRFTTDD